MSDGMTATSLAESTPEHRLRRGRVFLNEDNNHFYCSHSADEMTAEGVDRLVDTYAHSAGLSGLFFCTNVKRALYDSRVWEPIWAGYDPDGPPDQPALAWLPPEHRILRPGSARIWPHHQALLFQRGVDHLARWLARSRQHGIEAWLTVRMNDWHANDRRDSYWHPEFWRQHPEFWRRPYRYEWWTDSQYDYSQPAVRQTHLDLIRELCGRFDPDGIELDWVRNPQCFRPGAEEEGLTLLTEFHREVRRLVEEAARRTGHRVRVGVRVPESPETCVRWGFDVGRWIREKLVDQVILSQFLQPISCDPPIELWTAIAQPAGVRLGLGFTPSPFAPFSSAPARKAVVPVTPEILRGSVVANIHRGIDRIYLFNFCYWEGGQPDRTRALIDLMDEWNDFPRLADLPRRHPVGYRDVVGPGEPDSSLLPASFLNGPGAISRYGHNTLTFSLPIGPAPHPRRSAQVIVGFARDESPPATPSDLEVRINGQVCPAGQAQDFPLEFPSLIECRRHFDIPLGALHAGRNAIECFSESRCGVVAWIEIAIQ